MQYGVKIWLALALTFLPAIQAYLNYGVLDSYPYVICLSLGAVISGFVALRWRIAGGKLRSDGSNEASIYEMAQAKRILVYLGPVCWVLSIALFANQICDRSPLAYHQVRLLNFSVHRKGSSTVLVESWRHPGDRQGISYDWRRMQAVLDTPVGQPLIVSVREGALGWDWVESIELAKP